MQLPNPLSNKTDKPVREGQKEKKNCLVSGNRPGENFLSLTYLHNQMCIRIYISNFKKHKKKQEDKKQKKLKKKRKYLMESLISFANLLCVLLSDLIES